ncbi:MAG: hypothetical protein H6581_10905 [Bacteroidia bacterium]|nr:hypothetical protein [Bacteroidia bacterium]
MKSPFNIQIIHPATLSNPEKADLTDRLYLIHQQIFQGVSKADFRKYVIEPNSKLTRIRLYQDQEGNDAGYMSFQVFETGKSRRDPYVIRTEVGFLPNYRRYNLTLPTLIKNAFAFQLRHPGRKAYFLATPVHPTPYRLGLAQLPEVWPHPEKQMPAKIKSTFDFLKERLHIQSAETGSEFTCKVGWQVKESQVLADRIASRKDPWIQYYLQHNPDYAKGNGMLMLVPLTAKTYLKGFAGLLQKKLQRAIEWKSLTVKIPVPRFSVS